MIGEEGAGTFLRRNLPRALAVGLALLLVALLAYGLASTGSDTSIDEGLAGGEAPPAPPFDLPVLEPGVLPEPLERRLGGELADGRVALEELRGTPFVLNFWASWCNPCRDEAPVLAAGWRRFGPHGVLFIGLDMQDVTEDGRRFLDEFGISYPTIREPSNEIARAYGATGIPETYFVSARGRVVAHVVGVVSKGQLAEGVAAARAERVVGTLTGGARRVQP